MSRLVLTRKAGEAIMIGSDIVVTLIEVQGRQARIAVQAPKEVAVDRQEIRERKDLGDDKR